MTVSPLASSAGPPWPTGTTRLAAVIGHPVRHSLSPVLYNAAFRAADLDWAYVALEVAPGAGEAAVRAVATLGLGGLSVTMPHKQAAARACDRLAPEAAALGAVNCVVPDAEGLTGHSTDGPGLVASLREQGHDPAGMACAVIGAGGAARAIVHSLDAAGAASVTVVARRSDAAREAASLAPRSGRVGADHDLRAADLVCNATPVGMTGTAGAGQLPLDAALLRPGQVVVDIVYHPVQTPLLELAAAAGAATVTGIGMLVHQAALAFERWTGAAAPLAEMHAAAEGALNRGKRSR